MKKFLVTRNREDGFTLIELLVVVIIIAILAAIAVPVYIGIQNNAKKSGIASDVATTKLNLAAALTEDGAIASGTYTAQGKSGDATVQNSGVGGDETITVTVAADGKSYTVKGSSAKINYSSTYDSTTAQQTSGAAAGGSGGGGSAVPAGTVAYQSDFTTNEDGWTVTSDATVYKNSVGLEIQPNNNGATTTSGAQRTITGLVVGTSYTISADIGNSYDRHVGFVVGVDGVGDSATQVVNGYNPKTTVSYTFTATATSHNVHIGTITTSNIYDRDNVITTVKVISN